MKKNQIIILVLVLGVYSFTVQADKGHTEKLLKEFLHIQDDLSLMKADEEIVHCYLMKRTIIPIEIIKALGQKGKLFLPAHEVFFEEGMPDAELKIAQYSFKEEDIKVMMQSILMQKNFDPLFITWDTLFFYKYKVKKQVFREFFCALVCIFEASLKKYFFKKYMNLPQEIRDQLTTGVDNLKLDELLAILDHLVSELPEFIEKYELNTEMTWEKWFKKYWPVAPLALITLLLRAYLTGSDTRVA